MKADTPSISNIFNYNSVLIIPFFQRQYVWEEKEWERFKTDMDSLVNTTRSYFLGSLIFKTERTTDEERSYGICDKYTVIDGQQRLTTLSIFLRVLNSLLYDENLRRNFKSAFFNQDGNNSPVLRHSINDRAAFREVMCSEVITDNTLLHYEDKRVVKAYHYFHDHLSQKDQASLRALWMAIYANIKFVEIILDDMDDEQQIFDTINSLGVDLTIDELMKNFLYEVNEENAYNNNWKPVFDDDAVREFWGTNDASKSQAATDENKVISNFFYDFVRIKMWDYAGSTGFDRKSFVQKSQIFSTCKTFVEVFKANKQDLANEIIEYAKLYKTHFDKKKLNNRIPTTFGIDRIACIAMSKDSTIVPYILYVLKNVSDLTERNKIFGLLETYLVRRMVCLPQNANKMSTEFFTEQLVAKKLNTYDKLKDYLTGIDEGKNMHMPSDDEVKRNINRTVFGDESIPRLILYLQETKLGYNQNSGGYNYFVAEFIIPKQSTASDKNYPPCPVEADEQVRRTKIRTLGNFLLLGKTCNQSMPEQEDKSNADMLRALKSVFNEPFSQKKKVLCDYISTVVCSNWFNNQNSWSVKDIDTRNSGFVSTVIPKLWPL